MKKSFFALAISLSSAGIVCLAQSNPNLENGIRPFGSYDVNSIDSVNLATGGLSLNLPILRYPERWPVPLTFKVVLTSKSWYINPHCLQIVSGNNKGDDNCTPWWQLSSTYDGTSLPNVGVAVVADNGAIVKQFSKYVTTFPATNQKIYSYTAIESDGSKHAMVPTGNLDDILISSDGTAITCFGCVATDPPINMSYSTYSRNGILAVSNEVIDPNSNVMSYSTDGTGLTDTLGRMFTTVSTTDFSGCTNPTLTTSATIISGPGYKGNTAMIKQCFITLTLNTAFNDTDYYAPPANASQMTPHEGIGIPSVVNTIILYDGNSWSSSPAWIFQYDNDGRNGNDNNGKPIVYGDLVQITLPTGGTISYTWGSHEICTTGGGWPGVTNMSRGVTSRTESAAGSPPIITTYTYGGGGIFAVSDGVNLTLHGFTGLGGTCSFYETET